MVTKHPVPPAASEVLTACTLSPFPPVHVLLSLTFNRLTPPPPFPPPGIWISLGLTILVAFRSSMAEMCTPLTANPRPSEGGAVYVWWSAYFLLLSTLFPITHSTWPLHFFCTAPWIVHFLFFMPFLRPASCAARMDPLN